MSETQYKASECWNCGYVTDTATGISDDVAPEQGDASVCISCGIPGVFVEGPDGMRVVQPTPEEELVLYEKEDVKKLMFAIAYAKSKDPNWPKGPRG